MRIYVASSWRNTEQPTVIARLRDLGHEVYDFHKSEDHVGAHWEEVAVNGTLWTPEEYIQKLTHPVAERDFQSDFQAMLWADAIVMLYPCGRSAHLEAGWAAGSGKELFIILSPDIVPDLMVKMADRIFPSPEAFYNFILRF